MALLLGQLADLVGEMKSFAEVLEFELAFEVVVLDDLPCRVEFTTEPGQVLAFERRNPTLARHTFLFS